jgi:hypothetical protein
MFFARGRRHRDARAPRAASWLARRAKAAMTKTRMWEADEEGSLGAYWTAGGGRGEMREKSQGSIPDQSLPRRRPHDQ